MNVFQELDKLNTYKPGIVNNTEISAERTFGEANRMYESNYLYSKYIEKEIKNGKVYSPKDIYDITSTIASGLGEVCEMYLKAIYLEENKDKNVDELWKFLKSGDEITTKDGDKVYVTQNGVYTFPMKDKNGEIVTDNNGEPLYTDLNSNIYKNNEKGRKAVRNGHQLDRLISILEPNTRLLLETAIISTDFKDDINNSKINTYDIIKSMDIVDYKKYINNEKYSMWLDKHKKIFEEARYSGQNNIDCNLEFLFHLTLQIQRVTNYIFHFKDHTVIYFTKDEFDNLPIYLKSLIRINPNILTSDIYNKYKDDDEFKDKIQYLLGSLEPQIVRKLNSEAFGILINDFNKEELNYIYDSIKISESIANSNFHIPFNSSDYFINFVELVYSSPLTANDIILFFKFVKMSNISIEYDNFKKITNCLATSLILKVPCIGNDNYHEFKNAINNHDLKHIISSKPFFEDDMKNKTKTS